MNAPTRTTQLPVDLGDGLVLRRATLADRDALAVFNEEIHAPFEADSAVHRIDAWTRDLASGQHPTFAVEDFTIVEERRSGKIVSSANLISQTWSYEDIPIKVGRPELVGTDPQYRNRGLVRKQFDVLHACSEERDELLQAITGIPYYYRLFGYEMAVPLEMGRAYAVPQQIPKLKEGESEPYQIRPAVESDIPFLVDCYQQGRRRWLLSADWTAELLQYEISGKSPENISRVTIKVIVTPDGKPVGFFTHVDFLWPSERAVVGYFDLLPGQSWYAIVPVVMRHMVHAGEALTAREKKERLQSIELQLGTEHPAYEILAHLGAPEARLYTWYLRVPDLPRLINHIAPVLERRLAGSLCPGYSGTLDLSFYRNPGLRLTLENGALTAEPARVDWDESSASFPRLTFLQLLFGYRSLAELRYAFPDCRVRGGLEPVLNALFPKKPSLIWPVS